MSVLDVAAGSQAAAQGVKPGWIAVNVIIPEPMAVPGGTVRESISAAATGCRRFVVEFSQTTPETTPPFDATAESSVKSIPRPWTAPPAGAARGPARDPKRFCRGDPVWMVAAVHTGPADDNWTPLSRADCKRLEEARANGEQTCRIEGGRKLVRSAIRSLKLHCACARTGVAACRSTSKTEESAPCFIRVRRSASCVARTSGRLTLQKSYP